MTMRTHEGNRSFLQEVEPPTICRGVVVSLPPARGLLGLLGLSLLLLGGLPT